MKIDYKKAYEDLRKYLIDLSPYCNNCAADIIDDCDDCHRKYFNWSFNEECIKPLSEYKLKDK